MSHYTKRGWAVCSILCCVAALLSAGRATAGPNENGTLILALSEGTTYTSDEAPYCGSSTIANCEDAVTSVSPDGSSGPVVVNVLAAFPSTTSPEVDGVAFGVNWVAGEGFAAIDDWGGCGDFELPDSDWPTPGSGVAVTWSPSENLRLFEVYWFAIDADVGTFGPGTFWLVGHPSSGGVFAGDHPVQLDPITGFGRFGFGEEGASPCPGLPGGCCLADGSCDVLTPEECETQDGVSLGSSPCSPNPCSGFGVGACCLPTGECVEMIQMECLAASGEYQGHLAPCEPNPCPLVGACCFEDCSCVITSQEDCLAQGGSFRGGSTCLPDTCPCPTGACCFGDGCIAMDEAECDFRGGVYLGDGSNCDPNLCVPVPTHQVTWGSIKHRHR